MSPLPSRLPRILQIHQNTSERKARQDLTQSLSTTPSIAVSRGFSGQSGIILSRERAYVGDSLDGFIEAHPDSPVDLVGLVPFLVACFASDR